MCSLRSTLAIVVNMTDIELTDCPNRHKRLQTTYPSRCLLGVFDVAGVGFALFSSLDVDSEDTDAKSSFKNQTKNIMNSSTSDNEKYVCTCFDLIQLCIENTLQARSITFECGVARHN